MPQVASFTHSAFAESGEPEQVAAAALQVLLTTQLPVAALQVAVTAPSKPAAQVAAGEVKGHKKEEKESAGTSGS